MIKKILASLFGLAFLSFVIAQYNDPDPLLWMSIYALAAALSFLAAFNKAGHRLLLLSAALYAIGGVYMWPAKYEGISIGGGDIKNIEEAREALGLFLCGLAFISYILLDKFSGAPQKREG